MRKRKRIFQDDERRSLFVRELGRVKLSKKNISKMTEYNFAREELFKHLLVNGPGFAIMVSAFKGSYLFDKWESFIFEDVWVIPLKQDSDYTEQVIRQRIFYRPNQLITDYVLSDPCPEETFIECRHIYWYEEDRGTLGWGDEMMSLMSYAYPPSPRKRGKFYRDCVKILSIFGDEKLNIFYFDTTDKAKYAVRAYYRDHREDESLNLTIFSRYLSAQKLGEPILGDPLVRFTVSEEIIEKNKGDNTASDNLMHYYIKRMPSLYEDCEDYFQTLKKYNV